MDCMWMIDWKRGDPTYDAGLSEFYEFVRKNVKDTSIMPCPCEEYRSDYIARAMTCRECGRGRKHIFAPYHEGNHWMLGAISPSDSTVYWCDPAGYMEPRQFFVETVTRAFEKRNSIKPLAGFEAKPLTWKIIKCPRQPVGSVLCGYYVCRYMLNLIKARYVNITPNFMLTAPPSYTVEQIDEVRNIWVEFTLNFKP